MPFVYLDVSAGALHALRYVDHGEGKRCSASTSARESEKGERERRGTDGGSAFTWLYPSTRSEKRIPLSIVFFV